MYPEIILPPRPVFTRWGTWIEAAIYYCDNLNIIAEFLNQLDPLEAKCIRKAQVAISHVRIKVDLAYIKANFACIPTAIKKLESSGLKLSKSIEIFKSVKTNLETLARKEFVNKYSSVLNKNEGLTILSKLAHILDGKTLQHDDNYINNLEPNEIAAFNYAPTTSCDVERTFSAYKRVLEDCRRNMTFENVSKHVIIHCFQNNNEND